MIGYDAPILVNETRINVPADVEPRITIDSGRVTICLYAHSDKGRRWIDVSSDAQKADFVHTVLGREYGLGTKDFSCFEDRLEVEGRLTPRKSAKSSPNPEEQQGNTSPESIGDEMFPIDDIRKQAREQRASIKQSDNDARVGRCRKMNDHALADAVRIYGSLVDKGAQHARLVLQIAGSFKYPLF